MEPQRILSTEDTAVRRTVLVVDDDEATCTLLAEWIGHLGFDVATAQSAHKALTLMRTHPADVAFCDIVMPGKDGIWLIDQLRHHFPETAVVIATGLTRMDPSVTLSPRVAAYLVKPFDFDDVASALGSAFDALAVRYRH
jgi:two-component system NtrC family sensor kinase